MPGADAARAGRPRAIPRGGGAGRGLAARAGVAPARRRGDEASGEIERKELHVKGPTRVGIVLGSDSDLEVMLEAVKVLDALEVGSEVVVASAHRTPDRAREYATTAHTRGLGVLIAGAGGAAALPGFLASLSPLPVSATRRARSSTSAASALRSIGRAHV